MSYEVEFTDQDLNEAERGYPIPGWYPAMVIDAYEDHDKPGSYKLQMQITEGKWTGHIVFQSFDDLNTLSEEAAKMVKKKVLIWAPRLECIPRGTAGKVSIDWRLAIGKEIALKIIKRTYEKPKGSNNWSEINEPAFDGIYLRYDDRVPADIRSPRPAGAPPAPGSAPNNAAAIEAGARAAVGMGSAGNPNGNGANHGVPTTGQLPMNGVARPAAIDYGTL